MAEKDIERWLIAKIEKGDFGRVLITNSTSGEVKALADLIGRVAPQILHDTSDWNNASRISADLSNMTPDLVLRCPSSGENRIYIEVKQKEPLLRRYGKCDSQVVRYFLHLLVTTNKKPRGQQDIRRAVLLAAPSTWFAKQENAVPWNYFLATYKELAGCFDITLGEIRCDALIP